jgi:hypothetical protein
MIMHDKLQKDWGESWWDIGQGTNAELVGCTEKNHENSLRG